MLTDTAVISDVTDRTVLAQALQHLDTLLAYAPFGFVFLDRDLRFMRINDQLAEMHGYSIAAHLGKTVAEIVPTLEATVREVTARILATGQPVLDHESTGQTAREPGVTRTWNESWYPARDEHGEIIGFSAMVVDITERKQADAALRANTALFYEIIEQAPGGVYVVDAQFRLAQVNAEALPTFASVQPLIGCDFDEVMDVVWGPEIGPQCASIFRHTLATGERYVSPRFSEQRHDIGVEQAFEWETQRITLPDGQHGVVCYFKDVTERERAETVRRDSAERLQMAIAGSDLGTWHWDICTGELDWSERCLKIFGIPAGTAMSYEKFVSVLHPEDRARADDAVQHALQDGSEYRIELRNVWPDGSVHWAVSLGRAYYDATGVPTRMEGICLDITDRKRAEVTLRETERQYQALAEASEEIPYRMSADWSTLLPLDGRGLFESSDSPLNDWAWLDQNLPRDEHARVKQAINEAIAQKNLFEMEHRVLRHNGFTSWVRSRAVPVLDENEDLVAWFGAASDITERKQIELNLIEATAIAEKANRAKSDFLSSMSHELRTPLNAILGFAQLLESGVPAPTPAQQRNLEQILKGGWYLLDLINELLDLALIETGELSFTQEPVSFTDIMRECRAMIEPQARKRAITMIFPSSEHLGYVNADHTRVKQVMINLLSNAIKYNKAQGTLTVEVALRSPDAIRVSVRDTGEGLAPEKLAQLFQPFNRLGKEAGLEEGAGIGLALSKRLVELMGGSIGADSEVGVGSVFWFELKLASA
jgi:PAS domain S-box-containing protein